MPKSNPAAALTTFRKACRWWPSTTQPVHVHYVLHDGNDATFYGILTNAVPKGACKYGDPVFHEDGTLTFPMDMPEEVYGFLRVNTTTFKPLWPDCVRRTKKLRAVRL